MQPKHAVPAAIVLIVSATESLSNVWAQEYLDQHPELRRKLFLAVDELLLAVGCDLPPKGEPDV